MGDVDPVACDSIGDVFAGVADGSLDSGLVPLENAIEGTVSATIDGLVFDHDFFIMREIVLPIHMHLLARSGVKPDDVTRVSSYVHALAQVRGYLLTLPLAQVEHSASTSQAAREVAASDLPWAAVGSSIAARTLDSTSSHPISPITRATPRGSLRWHEATFPRRRATTVRPSCASKTRTVPAPCTASWVDSPLATSTSQNSESRPTKLGLGDYCFIIEFDGHIGDDIVGDCLSDLQAHLVRVKFLGSYPVTGEGSAHRREEVGEARRSAAEWISSLRGRIRR